MTDADVIRETLKEEGFTPVVNDGMSKTAEVKPETQGGEDGAASTNGATKFTLNDDDASEGNANTQSQNSNGNAANGNGDAGKREVTQAEFDAYLKENYGITSDEVPTVISEREHFRKLNEATPYKSQLGSQFDELVAKNVPPEKAFRYLTSDATKLGDKELLAMVMTIDRSDLTDQEISDYIDMKYGIGSQKKDDVSEKEGLLKLKFDVGEHRKGFDTIKSKLIEPLGVNKDAVKQDFNNKQRVEQWKGHTKKLFEEFSAIDIPVGANKEGKPLDVVPFRIKDKSVIERLQKDAQTIIDKNPGLVADENGVRFLKDMLADRALKYSLPQIAYSLVQSGHSKQREHWSKILHNTQLQNGNAPHDFGGGSGDVEDKFVNAIAAVEQGRYGKNN